MSIAMHHARDTRRVETQDHRIVIGPEVVRDGAYYLTALDNGQVLLTPVDSVPEDERAVWENPHVREALARGLDQAAHGKLVAVDNLFDDLDDE